MISPFSFAANPQLHFGAGKISILPSVIKTFGSNVLLVTGANSFDLSPAASGLLSKLESNKITFERVIIPSEPTPGMIDLAVKNYFDEARFDVVVAIGGGSVVDAGKAIAAMLPLHEPVKNYLEGVGTKLHPGTKIPFIAVPTTSGTGSEATKNAVLAEVGVYGYKKSLRHNNFVPDVAIVDPVLTVSCSAATTAASGMDAFTQLLESCLSTSSNPLTDALAYEGLRHISSSLPDAFRDGANLVARTDMALAAYLSGVTLANAGLGLVHGFASTIGGNFPIAHGVICSSLMWAVNRVTLSKLRSEASRNIALIKYASAGKIFTKAESKSDDYYADVLLETIESYTSEMKIPRLQECGIKYADLDVIARNSDNKNNPVALNDEEKREVLEIAYDR